MKTIIVKKTVSDVWKKEISITLQNAKDAKISYNAFKNAIQTGICTQKVHDKINTFLFKQRSKLEKITG